MDAVQMIDTKIISPDQEIYNGSIEMVVLPGEEGDFAAMFEHAPLITFLRTGKIQVFETDKDSIIYFVSGGFVKIEDNSCVVMVDYIKQIADIDVKSNEERITVLLDKVNNENNSTIKENLLYDISMLKSENSVALEG